MPVIEVPVRAQTRRRVRTRLPAVLAIWVLAVLCSAWVASSTRIGPVVEELNSRHGVHAFDVVMALVLTATASFATWELLRPRPGAPGDDADAPVAIELRRIPVVIAGWVAVTALSAWLTFEVEVGPILARWNNHRALRLGDLVLPGALVLVWSVATVVLLRPRAER